MSKIINEVYNTNCFDKQNGVYNCLLSNCKHNQIDTYVIEQENIITEYSRKNNIDIKEIKKQIRLHLPKFEIIHIKDNNFWCNELEPILNNRFKSYTVDFTNYLNECGYKRISSGNFKIKNNVIFEENSNENIDIDIREVEENEAIFIEEKLHYLHTCRTDGFYRIGLYIKGYKLPICYMSFCKIDRIDKLETIKKSLNINNLDSSKIIELSRVFGCGNLPSNTISFLIAFGTRYYRNLGYKYMITAVNPYLGYRGTSIMASNFLPFAIRPVKYIYSTITGEYAPIRTNGQKREALIKMPGNILYIKKIEQSKKTIQINFIE